MGGETPCVVCGSQSRFELGDEVLEDLPGGAVECRRLAADENGRIWSQRGAEPQTVQRSLVHSAFLSADLLIVTFSRTHSRRERRQLTVEFIDLVGSTPSRNSLTPKTTCPRGGVSDSLSAGHCPL